MSRRGRKKQRQAFAPANMTRQDSIAKDRRLTLQNGNAWAVFGGVGNYAGKTVTMESMLQLSTAWACIRLTAQALSCLPAGMYQKAAHDSRDKVEDGVAEILCDSPNEDQTPQEYWETVAAWGTAEGNSYSEKVTSGNRVIALQPLSSLHCSPVREPDGTLVYRFNDRGRSETLPRGKVFHVKGMSFGGDRGLSPIRFGAQTFGSAIAMQETTGKMYGAGLQSSGFLKMPANVKLDPQQRADLQRIMGEFAGSSNAGKMMVLEGGMEFNRLALTPVDAEMLANLRFGVEEICRWYGMPPIIIGHAAQGQTMWGTGVEAILIAWLTLGINPLCTRIEARVKKDLIRPYENKRRYFEYNREALLQMDSAAKAAFLSTMTQNGLMTRNEGRQKLNLPWQQGADQLTAQTNLAPLDKLGGDGSSGAQARAALRAWLLDQTGEKQHEQA